MRKLRNLLHRGALRVGSLVMLAGRRIGRLVWNRVTLGLLLIGVSVYGAFWTTEVRQPPTQARSVGFTIPGVSLPAFSSYITNLTVKVRPDQIGGYWSLGKACRNPVEVVAYVQLDEAVWEERAEELDGRAIPFLVGINGQGIRNFEFYGAAEPASELKVFDAPFVNPFRPYTDYYGYVFQGVMRDWASHHSRVEFRFEADWLFERTRGSCYLALPSLIGGNTRFPGSSQYLESLNGANALVTDAYVDYEGAIPPPTAINPPFWVCAEERPGETEVDCAAIVALSSAPTQELPSFVLFLLGALAAVGAELALTRLRG